MSKTNGSILFTRAWIDLNEAAASKNAHYANAHTRNYIYTSVPLQQCASGKNPPAKTIKYIGTHGSGVYSSPASLSTPTVDCRERERESRFSREMVYGRCWGIKWSCARALFATFRCACKKRARATYARIEEVLVRAANRSVMYGIGRI